jgi:hypothetical protein
MRMLLALALALACGAPEGAVFYPPERPPPLGYTPFRFTPAPVTCYFIECAGADAKMDGKGAAFTVDLAGVMIERVAIPGELCPTHETVAIVVAGDSWNTPCWAAAQH